MLVLTIPYRTVVREATGTQEGRRFYPRAALILGEHLIGSTTRHLSNQLRPGGSWLCPVTEASQDFLRGSNAVSSQRPTFQGWLYKCRVVTMTAGKHPEGTLAVRLQGIPHS